MKPFAYLTSEEVEAAKNAYVAGIEHTFLDVIMTELDIEEAETGVDRDHTAEEREILREKRLYEIFELK